MSSSTQHPNEWRWFLYSIVAEISADEFVVKVGATNDPGTRYINLLTGIPFKSVMLYAPVKSRQSLYQIEKRIHLSLKPHRTRGEWFRFSLESKATFHRVTKVWYEAVQGHPLQWFQLKESEAHAFENIQRRLRKRYRQPRVSHGRHIVRVA